MFFHFVEQGRCLFLNIVEQAEKPVSGMITVG